MYKFFPSLLFACLLVIATARGQDSTTAKGEDDGSGWFAIPFAGYSPETHWTFGAAGIYYFYTQPPISEDARLSNLVAAFQYTTKKQTLIELNYDLYFKNDGYRFYGYLAFAKFPFTFFGIGNNTQKDDQENYTPRYINSENSFMKNFIKKEGSGLNAGIRYDFRKDEILEKETGGLIDSADITGQNGGVISGLGLIINWDTRDNTFSSTEGEYIEILLNLYGSYLFSDFTFTRFILNIRKYFSVPLFDTTHVFATQFAVNLTTGDVPFYKLSTFGGNDAMRGVFQGRYRDKNAFYIQTEYRFHVLWRIGLAAFSGIGEVAPRVSSFATKELKLTYGFGVRFSIIPEQKIQVRIDFGFSKGESQLYLAFNEAF